MPSAGTFNPTPTRPSATSSAAMSPRQRVFSIFWPAKPSSAGSSVSDAKTVAATTAAAPTERPWTNLTPMSSRPSSEITTVMPAKSTRAASGVEGDPDRLAHGMTHVELLAVASDDQQRVVDADAEPDHDPEEGREVGDGQDVAQQRDDRGADADAEERDADRQAHREHRAERQDQDDDGERETDHFGRRRRELAEDHPAELDLQAVDLRCDREDLVADLTGADERDVVRELDVGERDLSRLGALLRDLRRTTLFVGALHAHHVGDLGDLVEEVLHRGLDLGILDPLFGPEDDRADLAGTLAAELLFEDVETADATRRSAG